MSSYTFQSKADILNTYDVSYMEFHLLHFRKQLLLIGTEGCLIYTLLFIINKQHFSLGLESYADHAVNEEIVSGVSQLEGGDHIKWERTGGYAHHAIVVRVHRDYKKVDVIHYASPNKDNSNMRSSITASRQGLKVVIQETMDPLESGDQLKKYIYGNSLSSSNVIERATKRLGEKAYRLFSNNCEHFATHCKTGKSLFQTSFRCNTENEC